VCRPKCVCVCESKNKTTNFCPYLRQTLTDHPNSVTGTFSRKFGINLNKLIIKNPTTPQMRNRNYHLKYYFSKLAPTGQYRGRLTVHVPKRMWRQLMQLMQLPGPVRPATNLSCISKYMYTVSQIIVQGARQHDVLLQVIFLKRRLLMNWQKQTDVQD